MNMMGLIIKFLLVVVLIYSQVLPAQVSHISINSRQFELGQPPVFKVNFIDQHADLSLYQFAIKQTHNQQTIMQVLMAEKINPYLLHVQGNKEVTDTGAELIVSRLHSDHWAAIITLALFDAPISDKSAALTSTGITSAKVNQIADTSKNSSSALVDSVQSSPVKSASVSSQKTPPYVEANCTIERNDSDTLWKIANRYKGQWNTNVYGAMLAIFESNLIAFSKQRIHLLLKDAPLICPSNEILTEYNDKSADRRVFEVIEAKHLAQ
ncbi:FimV/HubP family polar landmark protein [Shewanella sp. HL-SH8]|uniref:FimV/HubP family polar landmark protein n=1 Tax=Shewanella sp. HL-SH8 TaxID=3436242 RepID=UPI003EC0366C